MLISLSKAVSRGYTTIVLHIVHLVRLSSLSSTSVAVIGDSAKPDLRLPSQPQGPLAGTKLYYLVTEAHVC